MERADEVYMIGAYVSNDGQRTMDMERYWSRMEKLQDRMVDLPQRSLNQGMIFSGGDAQRHNSRLARLGTGTEFHQDELLSSFEQHNRDIANGGSTVNSMDLYYRRMKVFAEPAFTQQRQPFNMIHSSPVVAYKAIAH